MIKFIKELNSNLKSLNIGIRTMIEHQVLIENDLHSLVKANKEFINTLTQFLGFKAQLEFEEKKRKEQQELERKASKYDSIY